MSYYIPVLNEWKKHKNELIIKNATESEKYLVYIEDGFNYISEKQTKVLQDIISLIDCCKFMDSHIIFMNNFIDANKISKDNNYKCDYQKLFDSFFNTSYISDDKCRDQEIFNYINELINQINILYDLDEKDVCFINMNGLIDNSESRNIFDINKIIHEITDDIEDYNEYTIDREDYFEINNLNVYTQVKLCLKNMKIQLYKNQNKILKNYKELQTLYYNLINKLHDILLK